MKDRRMIAILGILFVIFISIVLYVTFFGIDHKIVVGQKDCPSKELELLGTTGNQGVYSLCAKSVTFFGVKGKTNEIKKDKLLKGDWKSLKDFGGTEATYYRGLNYYIVDCKSKIIITTPKYVDSISHMC